jgi:hypothetical protein
MTSQSPDDGGSEPGGLRLLRILVTTLMGVMIFATITITVLLWRGYTNARAPLPEIISLPGGTVATAFTQGNTWYAVVTEGDEILIFNRRDGSLRQRIAIEEE